MAIAERLGTDLGMGTPDTDSWLGEALASYQPKSMPPSVWQARFRDDVAQLLAPLDLRDEREVRRCLSRLAVFLADFVDVRPDATLWDLLTREHVEGHLQRVSESGTSPGTVTNRQGTLNALLRARAGRRWHERRDTEQHLAPYTPAELDAVLASASEDDDDAAALARTILCGLAGATPPSRRRRTIVDVDVAGREVTVDGHTFSYRGSSPLPTSGPLDATAVERGRVWGRETLGFRLDVRRLGLTWLTEMVRCRPALEVLQLEGVGRDRLTAAVHAVTAGDAGQTVRTFLRFASSE